VGRTEASKGVGWQEVPYECLDLKMGWGGEENNRESLGMWKFLTLQRW